MNGLQSAAVPDARLPAALVAACRRFDVPFTRHVLLVHVPTQRLEWLRQSLTSFRLGRLPPYQSVRTFRSSTSRFGIGQRNGSHQTPTGLHRISDLIGNGLPLGTVFQARKPVGFTWQGHPNAPVAHRILWLEGLEPGHNRGGDVDSQSRCIYIHGVGDESHLGRPASIGCIHLAAGDLLPLCHHLEVGTLVWIG